MSEMDLTLPPELDAALTSYYTAPEPSHVFSSQLERELVSRHRDLLEAQAVPRIPLKAKEILERKPLMQTLPIKPRMLLALLLLSLLLLTGVVYAVARLTGYIPGVGFVQTDALRVLAEPVSQTRQGITVSIEQVIADSERMVIVYKTEGLTIAAANSKGEGAAFGSDHTLRLPDGALLEETRFLGYGGTPEPIIGGEPPIGGWPNYVERLVYPPALPQVNELTLMIPILRTMPAGAAPENWELTFRLKPAEPGMTFAQVVVFTPPSEPINEVTPAAGETSAPALSNIATLNGFTLRLDSVVELSDGFVFTGSLSWDEPVTHSSTGWISETGISTLKDASGQKIPIEPVQIDAPYDERKAVWSYRTNRKIFSGPLVLSFPSVNTTVLPPQESFEFDLGSNPQMGQSWEINRDFVFAGHTVRLLSARLVGPPDPCWKYALEFGFESSNAAVGVTSVNDVVPQSPSAETCSGGGGGGGGIHELVDPKISFVPAVYSSIPTGGVHRFTLDPVVGSVVTGPWQVAWNPPFSAEPTPTPEPEACLTLEKWTQLAGRNDPLPSELGGRILVSVDAGMSNMSNPTPGFPLIQISNLDGSDPRTLVNGGWETLSPDGRRLIYTNDNGFNILDLSTGQVSVIGVNGYAPIFSPDGSRILYTRFPGMYVMQADGSGSQKIDVGAAEITTPMGWLPDNQTILYSVMGGKGFTFVMRNLQSGETKELFTVHNKHGFGAVSPDGQWIAFVETGFGAPGWGVFIARLDGSERRLVASSEISIASLLTWSPDGEWLLVNTQDNRQSDPNTVYRPVLIKPATCQVVGIPPTLGYVEAWVK